VVGIRETWSQRLNSAGRALGRLPTQCVLPLGIMVGVLCAIHVIDSLTGKALYAALANTPSRVAPGQWYRPVTSQLVHANALQLAVEVGALIVVWLLACRGRSALRLLAVFVSANVLAAVTVLVFWPDEGLVRSLSGVSCGIYGLAYLAIISGYRQQDLGGKAFLIGVAMLGLMTCLYSAIVGHLPFIPFALTPGYTNLVAIAVFAVAAEVGFLDRRVCPATSAGPGEDIAR